MVTLTKRGAVLHLCYRLQEMTMKDVSFIPSTQGSAYV